MAAAATAAALEIEEFINGALVSWLESCLPRPEILSGYASLLDGLIIHSVWLQIDPEPPNHPVEIIDERHAQSLAAATAGGGVGGATALAALAVARTKNFECIVRNLKSLFEEEFRQTILALPDAYTLGSQPETRQGLDQMKILLTLLLGAAVQCPNKEIFIGRIKQLDVETQHAIVELIKQVTDSQSLVLTEESVELLTPLAMYGHIVRLTKERDSVHLKWLTARCAATDMSLSAAAAGGESSRSGQHLLHLGGGGGGGGGMNTSMSSSTSASAMGGGGAAGSSNSESNHLAVELADLKSRLRKLRQELEEKAESQLELREELDHKTAQYEKLRSESQEWYTESKRAAAYRDEVDVLRERAERADRLEIEVQKFREKLTDAEFYKTRVEELREDNRMLLETKEMLEDQLQRSRKRSEHVMTLESEIIKYKQKLNDMALERDVDRSKLEELLEENTQLQLVAKNLNSTTLDVDKSLSENEDECNSGDNSLSEQLTNSAQTRAIKLELENRRLAAALDQLKESSFHESTNKILDLEKEKKRLSLKLEQTQENIQRLTQQNTELEGVFKNALEENKKLQDSLDQRQKSYDRQSQEREGERMKLIDYEQHVETLNKDKQRIQTLNESIQRRADDLERQLEVRQKEDEQLAERTKEYDQTKERLYAAETKLSACDRENASLAKEVLKLKECVEQKSVQLDEASALVQTQTREVQKLTKSLEEGDQLQQRVVELEKHNQDLTSQRDIDMETIATLRTDLVTGTLATNRVRQQLEKLGLAGNGGGVVVAGSAGSGGETSASGEEGSLAQLPALGDELTVETVVEKLVRNPDTFKTVREIILNVSREQREQREQHFHASGGILQNAKSDMCVLCHRKEIYTVEKNIELSSPIDVEVSLTALPLERRPEVRSSVEHRLVLSSPETNAEMSRLAEQNAHYSALTMTLQTNNEELQAENAQLSVDVATLGSQITSLNAQLLALQVSNTHLAADKDSLLKQADSIKQEHKNLLHDQVTLQCLHDQLSAEYESLNSGKEQLKVVVRDLRNETRELRDRIAGLERQIDELAAQNGTMKTCSEDLSILRTEHSKLTDDFRNLFATSDRFKNEYKNIQEQYRMIRMENSKLKLQNTEFSGELNTKSDQVKMLDIEYTKVNQRCEMLLQMNADLDTDRKTLMDNVSQLLSQYHELLSHSLEDKQHFHEEEKSYTERVHNLSRQKEKLEEKIMEHYKKSESTVPKKKPFASSLVRRVKKASSDLMNKVPSRNRRSWVDDSRLAQSQFMIGSESGGNESDNSNEEPMSIASDTHLLQRNAPGRQSLQRELGLDNSVILRGIAVRNSLQVQPKHLGLLHTLRRNSVHGRLEPPDVTGSSLTLGTAGSRRTVYLIDENQKIAESNAGGGANATNNSGATATTTGTASTTAPGGSQNSASTPANTASTAEGGVTGGGGGGGGTATSSSSMSGNNGNSGHALPPQQQQQPQQSENPTTLLMYNRINTMIGGSVSETAANFNSNNTSQPTTSGSGGGASQQGGGSGGEDKTANRKRGEDKSNSIWYEYGCV